MRGLEFKKFLDRYAGIPLVGLAHALDEAAAIMRPRGPVDVQSILAIKLWGVGNLVMILPYLDALRRRFPRARLSFLTIESNRELLEGHPSVQHVFTMRTQGVLRPLVDLVRLVRSLRRERFDLLLDFEPFLRVSALLGFLGGAKQRIGFRTPGQARAALYTARVPYRSGRHMTDVFGDIVRSAGAEIAGLPLLSVPRGEQAAAKAQSLIDTELRGEGPLVALHPGSGDNFPGRRWPADCFAAVGDALVEKHGARVLVTGAAAERPLTHQVVCTMRRRGVDLAGRLDLRAWIELLARLDLLVSNDTAPVHIAGALGTPLVAVYGPNTPEIYGPLHTASRVAYKHLPCSPCLTNLNAKSSACRLPACILGIEVETVLAAAESLLAENGRVTSAPRAAEPHPSEKLPASMSGRGAL
ncbi:MAG: glycosyltransferase family 9 protein [Planctomycetota bacterium]